MPKHLTMHGYSKTAIYRTWSGMIRRCHTPTNSAYRYYGGRGIKVCDRWRYSFMAFLHDMGDRPDGLTLERINNDGDYEPSNCRWASRKEQALNWRTTRKIVIEGVEYKAAVLAEISGLKTDTLMNRAKTVQTLAELIDPKRRVFWEGLAMTPNSKTRTHCNFGHEYNEENTYWTPGKHRQCRICNYRRDRERRQRQREK